MTGSFCPFERDGDAQGHREPLPGRALLGYREPLWSPGEGLAQATMPGDSGLISFSLDKGSFAPGEFEPPKR